MSDPSIAHLVAQRKEFAVQADDLSRELGQIFEALGVRNLDEALDCIDLLQSDLGLAFAIVNAYRADPVEADAVYEAIEAFEETLEREP